MNTTRMKKCLREACLDAGRILSRHFGKIKHIRQKENHSSVVCEADLAAEACVIKRIQASFPGDAIIAEESGFQPGSTGITWVIDPLDGTSNFVAGIPWFGAQIGVLEGTTPLLAGIFLPTTATLYLAERGRGVTRNGRALHVSPEPDLSKVLCAFGFDPGCGDREARRTMRLLRRVSSSVRNVRATNSLVDFCYVLEGHFGGAINLNTKIWDIVPASLMVPEAGGKLTDLKGRAVEFDLSPSTFARRYEVLVATGCLHPQLVRRCAVAA